VEAPVFPSAFPARPRQLRWDPSRGIDPSGITRGGIEAGLIPPTPPFPLPRLCPFPRRSEGIYPGIKAPEFFPFARRTLPGEVAAIPKGGGGVGKGGKSRFGNLTGAESAPFLPRPCPEGDASAGAAAPLPVFPHPSGILRHGRDVPGSPFIRPGIPAIPSRIPAVPSSSRRGRRGVIPEIPPAQDIPSRLLASPVIPEPPDDRETLPEGGKAEEAQRDNPVEFFGIELTGFFPASPPPCLRILHRHPVPSDAPPALTSILHPHPGGNSGLPQHPQHPGKGEMLPKLPPLSPERSVTPRGNLGKQG
ncbi:WAS/WASL-interacting protein family member 1-like, partial [Corapipo altera]|uniref:WAS/WASL-interacting protein family member 1-like n=1 Tax=Corapipo altera TaxID=415028 RepID=UPI000FD65EB0